VKVKGVALSWKPNPEQDITSYYIYRATEGRGGNFSNLSKVTGQTQFTDKDLKDGQSYWYKVQAGDKDELLSDFSDAVEVTTKPKPAPPQGLNAVAVGGGADVRWQPNQEKDIVSYTVYEKGFFKPEKLVADVKQTSYRDARPLKAGKERIYVVTATDRNGLESEFSQEVTVTGK
jgi:fibronectin type 3 domain-containing protein